MFLLENVIHKLEQVNTKILLNKKVDVGMSACSVTLT